jgi:hypothetical protein
MRSRVNNVKPKPKLMKVVSCIIDCSKVPIKAPITISINKEIFVTAQESYKEE